jgi:hypothetical protein
LEHDQPDEIDSAYQGAISINCGDENKCVDFLFKDIRVEDFSDGKLLTVKVEPGGNGAATTDGKYVKDIRFENLSYNGSGEEPSVIKGINCEKYVNGVHFQNFKVNGQLIQNLSDYNFATNNYAYNITFEEANNYSTVLSDGLYKIKNKQTGKYLHNSIEVSEDNLSDRYVITYPSQSTNYQLWNITKISGTGHYRIKNIQNENYLTNSDEQYANDCRGRYTETSPYSQTTNQEWKIVEDGQGYYTINNAYTRAYLHNSNEPYYYNSSGEYTINYPKNNYINQKWEIIDVSNPYVGKGKNNLSIVNSDVIIYPTLADDIINIQILNVLRAKMYIFDIQGRLITSTELETNFSSHNINNLLPGIYIIKLISDSEIFHVEKFIKE